MTLETLAGLAIILMVAALVGSWLGSRQRSTHTELAYQFETLLTLIEQTGKAAREDIETLRKTMMDTERVLGSKVDDGLRFGFDRSLATVAEGAKVQSTQIDSFRAEITAVSSTLTRLGTEVPAALEAAGTRAKLDAIEANRLLLDGLRAGLHEQDLRIEAFGAKMEASGVAVVKALGEFQTLLVERLARSVPRWRASAVR